MPVTVAVKVTADCTTEGFGVEATVVEVVARFTVRASGVEALPLSFASPA